MLYRKLIRPWFFKMDAETAHHTVFHRVKQFQQSEAFLQLARQLLSVTDQGLEVRTSGLVFPNPVGLAAGFDKNAELIPALAAAGFGFVEIGSITAQSSVGNPRPRLFRLPADQALINRMGLNNEGADAILQRLEDTPRTIPLGVNIAKTPGVHKDTQSSVKDYVHSFRLAVHTADYITLNISCPNTGDGKSFEHPPFFKQLLEGVLPFRVPSVPVFVKFSADTSDDNLDELLGIAEAAHIDGYVAVNTSTCRSGLLTSEQLLQNIGGGGLSGKPLHNTALNRVSFIRRRIAAEKTLISVGGISCGEDAKQRLAQGADLVQLYTALIYEGPRLPGRINQYLLDN